MRFGEIDIDDRVIKALKDNKLVIFAGAGVSMNSPCNCPDFENLAVKIGNNTSFDYYKNDANISNYFLGLSEKIKEYSMIDNSEKTEAINEYFDSLEKSINGFKSIDFRKKDESIDQYLGKLTENNIKIVEKSKEIMYEGHEESEKHNNLIEYSQCDIHNNIVEILRGVRGGEVRVVTTNFEHFFTKAYRESLKNGEQECIYYAPALPNGSRFSGLVYLHGAYEDMSYGKELVLTDKNFGEAYLSNGYANKFIKELFSSKYTILFIGYSYSDLMMHYLTRALGVINNEKWFAFDSINKSVGEISYEEYSKEELEKKWSYLRIKPIVYETLDHDHSTLHNSLEDLKNYILMDSDHVKKSIETLCNGVVDLKQTEIEFIIAAAKDNQYAEFVCKKATDVKFVQIFENEGLIKEIFAIESFDAKNKYITEIHRWMTSMFFKYPDELFRIKHKAGIRVTGLIWEALIREFCNYIQDSNGNIDFEVINIKLDVFVPLLLEYNPINLSLEHGGYKFSITWLVELLFKIDDKVCFEFAFKLFLYITTPHTTAIYNATRGEIENDVRFYGDDYSLQNIGKILASERYNYLTEDMINEIINNYIMIKKKLMNISLYNYESHIRDELAGACFIVIFKIFLSIKLKNAQKFTSKIKAIIEDVDKINEKLDCTKAEASWVDKSERRKFLHTSYLKKHSQKQVVEWIEKPDEFRKYCALEFGEKINEFTIFDNLALEILSDSFENDHKYCVDIIEKLEVLPDNIWEAIPNSISIVDNDKELVGSFGRLLKIIKGNEGYYNAIIRLINKTIDDNNNWFKNCFDEIENVLFSLEFVMNNTEGKQSLLDSSDPENIRQYTIALNSLGGEYSKLIIKCLDYRYKTLDKNNWNGLPECYSNCINSIIKAKNFNYEMARVILYRDLYYYYGVDTNNNIQNIFEGLYWLDDAEKNLKLFVQAWQGVLMGGRVSQTNIVDLFEKGIKYCIKNLRLFPSDCRIRLCQFLVILGISSKLIPKDEIVKSLLEITGKFYEFSQNSYIVFSKIVSYIREKSESEIIIEWDSWIKKFISERTRNIPVKITIEEITVLNELLYYVNRKSVHDEILGFIKDAIGSIDDMERSNFKLPIVNSNFKGNDLTSLSRLSLAKSLKIVSPKLSESHFYSAKDDLCIIVCEDGVINDKVFEIVMKAIRSNNKLSISQQDKIIKDLENVCKGGDSDNLIIDSEGK